MRHKVWFDDDTGVLHLALVGAFTFEDGPYFMELARKCYADLEKHYLVCHFRDGGTEVPTDKEYRKWLMEQFNQIGFDKIAMLDASPGMRMLAKIVFTAVGKSRQIRFVKSEKEALEWILTDVKGKVV